MGLKCVDRRQRQICIKDRLLSDPKILDIFETSKRGGLTFVGSQRYAKANDTQLPAYDERTFNVRTATIRRFEDR